MSTLAELYVLLRSFWVVWLVTMFVAVIAWAFWPSRRAAMEAHGRIPFTHDGAEG